MTPVTEDITWGRKAHKQAANDGGCSLGLAKHFTEETKNLEMSLRFRLETVIDSEDFHEKY